MSLDVTSELEQRVRSKIVPGRYRDASDVLTDALGLLEERELYTSLHRDETRAKLAASWNSLREGNGVDGEAVFARIERELLGLEPERT